MKKKVLMICYQYPPCASSGVFRTLKFIKNLPDCGWTPIVLTVKPDCYDNQPLDYNLNKQTAHTIVHKTPSLPALDWWITHLKKLFLKPKSQITRRSIALGKPINTTPAANLTHPTTALQKIKDAVTLSLMIPDKRNGWLPYAVWQGLKIIRNYKPDIIYASGRPWTAFLIGVVLKQITQMPLVIDFRDPWMDNPYDPHQFLLQDKINAGLEKYCVASANIVIANTEPLRQLFLTKYHRLMSPHKFFTITNGYDETEFQEINCCPTENNNNGQFVISHIGSLYANRNPEKFLLALSSLIKEGTIPQNNIKVILVGKADIGGLTQFLAQEELVSVVELKGHVPQKQALNIAAQSDLLLLLQPDTPLQIPAKLFEYIMLQKPILAICGPGATHDIVISNNFGLAADYNSPDDIKQKLSAIYQSHQHHKHQTVISNNNLAKFNAVTLTSNLAELFNQACRH